MKTSLRVMKSIVNATFGRAKSISLSFGVIVLGVFLKQTYQVHYRKHFYTHHCFRFPGNPTDPENNILYQVKQTIEIRQNGRIVGLAYCIAPQTFVTVCSRIQDSDLKGFQFVSDGFNYTHASPLAKFDNVLFFKLTNNHIRPIYQTEDVGVYTPVQLFTKRVYGSLQDSYIVAKQSKYAIIDGHVKLGSLVLSHGRVLGIVNKLGVESHEGYAKMVSWNDLKNNKRINPYLGISVKDKQTGAGAFVVRITTDSPFNGLLHLGDTITKVNNEKILQSMDLPRLITLSKGPLQFTVENDGKQRYFKLDI